MGGCCKVFFHKSPFPFPQLITKIDPTCKYLMVYLSDLHCSSFKGHISAGWVQREEKNKKEG